jgi:hypothetical protein
MIPTETPGEQGGLQVSDAITGRFDVKTAGKPVTLARDGGWSCRMDGGIPGQVGWLIRNVPQRKQNGKARPIRGRPYSGFSFG